MIVYDDKKFEKLNNTVVAIGKFDGLHKGHRRLIEMMTQMKDEGLLSVLFTFKKAPKEVLLNSKEKYLLTSREKELFLEKNGIDYYIQYPCDEEILSTLAEDFVKKIIVDRLGARKIVCGTDFHFGYKRQGDVSLLKRLAEKYGYEVIVIDKIQYNEHDISSTRIREEVLEGNIERVNDMLGYPYTMVGEVISGNRLGRQLGFPTANILPEDSKILPPPGVYYTKCNVNGKEYKGVTNIGMKPTVSNEGITNAETYFIDFSGNLYGRIIELKFYKYVRSERKFGSVEELKKSVDNDILGCIETDY